MSQNTTHVEGLDFTAQDHASAPAEKIAHSFEKVHHATEKVTHRLREFGREGLMIGAGAVGVGFGLRAIGEKAFEANTELVRVTKTLAGAHFAFEDWDRGTSAITKVNESMKVGAEIAQELDGVEDRLKMSRESLAGTYQKALYIGSRENLGRKEMLDLTTKLAAAEKVLGVSAEATAVKIAVAAQTGKLAGKDPLMLQIRSHIGSSAADKKRFLAMSEEQRFEKIIASLGDLVPAAERMGQDVEGTIFQIRDATDHLFRDFTGPLFGKVTTDLRDWATALDRAENAAKKLGDTTGGRLIGYYDHLKDATKFISDHWMLLAGFYGAGKLGGVLGGLGSAGGLQDVAAALSGSRWKPTRDSMGMLIGEQHHLRNFASRVGTAAAGLAGFTSKLLAVGPALGALYLGASAFAGWMEDRKTHQVAETQKLTLDLWRDMSGKAMPGMLRLTGLGGKGGVDVAAAKVAFEAMGYEERVRWSEKLGVEAVKKYESAGITGPFGTGVGQFVKIANTDPMALAKAFGESVADAMMRANPLFGRGLGVLNDWGGMLEGVVAAKGKTKRDKDNIVNINHLELHPEFKDPNPDRVWHRLVRDVVDAANNPRGSNIPAVPG